MEKSSAKSPGTKAALAKSTPPRTNTFSIGALCALLIAIIWIYIIYNDSIVEKLKRSTHLQEGYSTDPPLRDASFQWAHITPAKHLKYTACFDGFQCARLEVPMNWNTSDVHTGPKVVIAIIKLPAKVLVTDKRYGGAILLNPGGPGGSGVSQVLTGGKQVQMIVDPAIPPSSTPQSTDAKYFDIIGFDPRGVNNTTPPIKCFPDAITQQAWNLQVHGEGIVGSSDAAFNLMWARTIALGESCAQDRGDGDIVRNVNTAQVVRDMVEIIERHGEWREKEAESIMGQEGLSPAYDEIFLAPTNSSDDRTTMVQWKRNKEILNYWGFSYGSILGSTFAAMYPDRVGRMIIDGIVDPDDYYSANWLKNLQDTDKIVTQFCQYCAMAGPEKCPLYTGTGTSSVESEAYLNQIFGDLRRNPIPVPASSTRGPEIITYTDVKLMMITALYEPYREIEQAFEILALLSKKNGTRLADMKQQGLSPSCLNGQCKVDGPYSDSCWPFNEWTSNIAILSNDGNDVRGTTKEDYKAYVKQLERQSRWLGGRWAEIRMHCANWPIRPEWSFEGPIEGQTSHPLLVIGNSLDPVTPLRNAHTMAQRFPGSVVLQQDSEGHCSYSSPSICTARIVRQFFQTGELPTVGTICLPDTRPFLGCVDKDKNGSCKQLSGEDQAISDALRGLATVWP